jgi:hypothetical protein
LSCGDLQGVADTHAEPRGRPWIRAQSPRIPPQAVDYELPSSAGSEKVILRIYDVSGRLLRTLVDGQQTPGRYRVLWDGRDGSGRRVPNGICFFRLVAGERAVVTRAVILK